MSDLLPHNATDLEEALEAVTAFDGVNVRVRDVWNPAETPVLPWLAWAFSVDQWRSDWSDEQKIAVTANAIAVQKTKGTIGAMRMALGGIGIDAAVIEWHRDETSGEPYTFRLLIDATESAATAGGIEQVLAVVDRMKSLRSHISGTHVGVSVRAGPYLAAAAMVGSEIEVGYGSAHMSQSGLWDDTAEWSDFSIWGIEL